MSLEVRTYADGTCAVAGEPPAVHQFSPRLVQRGTAEGWMTVGRGRIVLHARGGDVAYRIVRSPGAYCCHCGDQVGDGPAADAAENERRAAYVAGCAAGHGGASPDPENPAGWRVDNFYACELEEG